MQLHDLSKAALISAKSVQYMTGCRQKLPMSLLEPCVNCEFSVLHSYFHYWLTRLPSAIQKLTCN